MDISVVPAIRDYDMDLALRLAELDTEVRAFKCRPQTLISDMVLVALGIYLVNRPRRA